MSLNDEDKKKCIYCNEMIPIDKDRCPYCGSLLDINVESSSIITGEPKEEPPKETLLNEKNNEGVYQERIVDNGNSNNGGSYYKPEYSTDRSTIIHNNIKKPLSNGMKVFLTVLFTVIPGFGQLAGIITSIIFMNTDGDSDRKSFGVALLIASLIMFVLSCISCFVLILMFSINQAAIQQ